MHTKILRMETRTPKYHKKQKDLHIFIYTICYRGDLFAFRPVLWISWRPDLAKLVHLVDNVQFILF